MGRGAGASVWVIAVLLSNDLWRVVVGSVNARARGMAGQATSGGIASPAAVIANFQLLTSKAVGQQIRRVMKTTPGIPVSGCMK